VAKVTETPSQVVEPPIITVGELKAAGLMVPRSLSDARSSNKSSGSTDFKVR